MVVKLYEQATDEELKNIFRSQAGEIIDQVTVASVKSAIIRGVIQSASKVPGQ